MNICIIGLGLIGGSMAIDLKKRDFAQKIYGVDANSLHANTAKNIGLVDEIATIEEGIAQSDLVILATPVNASLKLLPLILDLVENQAVTDVCSTKSGVCELVQNHRNRKQFVAAHPMAGTEYSGPWAAISNLFDGKAGIICEHDQSSDSALAIVEKMYETLNMRTIFMEARAHDMHAAYVSHISHISSFALALTVLDKEKNEKHIFDLASGGFRSTVRLAKSSEEMWVPIFNENTENVVEVLDTYIDKLQKFKEAIASHSNSELTQMIKDANKIRRII